MIQRIKQLLHEQNAVLVAHYYVDGDLQALAEETGGCVADSLEMARYGSTTDADTLIVCGVRFMGETAKILNPEKRVLMPDLDATCSLDEGCPADLFNEFCDAHPDRTVVVYANTSAAVKARADWMVTSGIALPIVRHLHEQGEKILWAPDKHLGRYVQQQTGADILLWDGSCVVHEEFKGFALERLKRLHPEAAILVHPESPAGRAGAGGRRRFDHRPDQGGIGDAQRGIHRRDRRRHLLEDAPAGAGQEAHLGARPPASAPPASPVRIARGWPRTRCRISNNCSRTATTALLSTRRFVTTP